jgi:uncharacterized membrane protein
MPDNDTSPEPTLFSALITPHRSLPAKGFLVLMIAIGGISFAAGVLFLLLGAWPIVGFFGLDVALVYWAFRANYRSAAAYEEISVTPAALTVRKVSHRGKVREWTLNPLWVRLEREEDEDFGLVRLSLVHGSSKLVIAAFLSPDEREDFARALSTALADARRGCARGPQPVPA